MKNGQMLEFHISTILGSAMPTGVPYPQYDELFFVYNQLRRGLDTSLKKHDLSTTGLQILTLVAQAEERRSTITRSDIAATLGLTDSTLSSAIKGLTAKDFIREKSTEDKTSRNQPLRLKPEGRKALHKGLVAREDLLEAFDGHLPKAQKAAFFRAVGSINQSIKTEAIEARKAKYIKSLSKRNTKNAVRATAWSKPLDTD